METTRENLNSPTRPGTRNPTFARHPCAPRSFRVGTGTRLAPPVGSAKILRLANMGTETVLLRVSGQQPLAKSVTACDSRQGAGRQFLFVHRHCHRRLVPCKPSNSRFHGWREQSVAPGRVWRAAISLRFQALFAQWTPPQSRVHFCSRNGLPAGH